jgi:cbb3-type cytochrome oxidase maturation protein
MHMDILYLLVPLSLVFVFIIAIVFWWNLKSGQFEDLGGARLSDPDGRRQGAG